MASGSQKEMKSEIRSLAAPFVKSLFHVCYEAHNIAVIYEIGTIKFNSCLHYPQPILPN